MQYYTPKEIAKLTGYSKDKCYRVIAKLNEELKKDYPNQFILCAKIPVWYWEMKILGKTKEEIRYEKTENEIKNKSK